MGESFHRIIEQASHFTERNHERPVAWVVEEREQLPPEMCEVPGSRAGCLKESKDFDHRFARELYAAVGSGGAG